MADDWNNSSGDVSGVEQKLWHNYLFRSCLEASNTNHITFHKTFLTFWANYVSKTTLKGDILSSLVVTFKSISFFKKQKNSVIQKS